MSEAAVQKKDRDTERKSKIEREREKRDNGCSFLFLFMEHLLSFLLILQQPLCVARVPMATLFFVCLFCFPSFFVEAILFLSLSLLFRSLFLPFLNPTDCDIGMPPASFSSDGAAQKYQKKREKNAIS